MSERMSLNSAQVRLCSITSTIVSQPNPQHIICFLYRVLGVVTYFVPFLHSPGYDYYSIADYDSYNYYDSYYGYSSPAPMTAAAATTCQDCARILDNMMYAGDEDLDHNCERYGQFKV